MRKDDCELCQAEKMTYWYRDEDLYWIAECFVCRTPMAVLRRHGMPTPEEEAIILEALGEVGDQVWGKMADGTGDWWLDKVRRQIPDHWHAHARPGWGFFG